jgi:hypothetical protein
LGAGRLGQEKIFLVGITLHADPTDKFVSELEVDDVRWFHERRRQTRHG